jgi:hypothetical protein
MVSCSWAEMTPFLHHIYIYFPIQYSFIFDRSFFFRRFLPLVPFLRITAAMRMKYRSLVEWSWQRNTEWLEETQVAMPLCQQQIWHGLSWDRTEASAVKVWQLTARSVAGTLTKIAFIDPVLTAHQTLSAPVTKPATQCRKVNNLFYAETHTECTVTLCVTAGIFHVKFNGNHWILKG